MLQRRQEADILIAQLEEQRRRTDLRRGVVSKQLTAHQKLQQLYLKKRREGWDDRRGGRRAAGLAGSITVCVLVLIVSGFV
jgi:hypothetical protein